MRPTHITRLLHADERIATATGRLLAVDWLESEKRRLEDGDFWRSLSIDISRDGLLRLVGIPNDGMPSEICRDWSEKEAVGA